MKIYALVIARKGSKGIKNKNLQPIKKKISLVENSILKAKKFKLFDKIFCSTDSKNIINKLKKRNIYLIKRPNHLAKDNSTAEEVVDHFYFFLKKKNINFPEILFLLQPTSPFLNYTTVKSIINKYKKEKKANSIISVIKVPHKFHYLNQRTVDKNSKINFLFPGRNRYKQRQQKKEVFCHGNIFSFKTKSFLRSKKILNSPIYSVKLKNFKDSIDIDNYWDLILARKFF